MTRKPQIPEDPQLRWTWRLVSLPFAFALAVARIPVILLAGVFSRKLATILYVLTEACLPSPDWYFGIDTDDNTTGDRR